MKKLVGKVPFLSARQVRADGYGGVDYDPWQMSGVVEPDHVNLPGSAVPHERSPQMPRTRRLRRKTMSESG